MVSESNPLVEMEIDVDELETLSELLHAFSQRTRLAILLGLYHDHTPPEIAEAIDVSRPGLQGHLTQMKEQRLIHRNNSGRYQLTPLGKYFAELIENQRDQLLNVIEYLDQVEEETEADFENAVSRESISNQEWQRLVSAQVWEKASGPIRDQLGLRSDEASPAVVDEAEDEVEAADYDISLFELPADEDNQVSAQVIDDLVDSGVVDDKIAVEPLYEVVDPDALDSLFEDDSEKGRKGIVAFEYQDRLLVLTIGGDKRAAEIVQEFAAEGTLEEDSSDEDTDS